MAKPGAEGIVALGSAGTDAVVTLQRCAVFGASPSLSLPPYLSPASAISRSGR